jgi:hypothetical protein
MRCAVRLQCCRESAHFISAVKSYFRTTDEDETILRLRGLWGGKWAEIAKYLPGRCAEDWLALAACSLVAPIASPALKLCCLSWCVRPDNAIKNRWNSALDPDKATKKQEVAFQ